jgi:hypothetical protein
MPLELTDDSLPHAFQVSPGGTVLDSPEEARRHSEVHTGLLTRTGSGGRRRVTTSKQADCHSSGCEQQTEASDGDPPLPAFADQPLPPAHTVRFAETFSSALVHPRLAFTASCSGVGDKKLLAHGSQARTPCVTGDRIPIWQSGAPTRRGNRNRHMSEVLQCQRRGIRQGD